jgi:hypothetical protein
VNEKNAINALVSGIYAAFAGSLVVFLGMMLNFLWMGGFGHFMNALGGSLLFYFFTAISSMFLTIFVCAPVYLWLARRGRANYVSASLIGLLLSLVLVGFFPAWENIYWAVAGAATGACFHYYFKKTKDLA